MEVKATTLFLFLFISSTMAHLSDTYVGKYIVEEFDSCQKSINVFYDLAVIAVYKRELLNGRPSSDAGLNCTTTTHSRSLRTGLISVIQSMRFRRNEECVDYVELNSEYRVCGNLTSGAEMKESKASLPSYLISNFSGPFFTGPYPADTDDKYVAVPEPRGWWSPNEPLKTECCTIITPLGTAVTPKTFLMHHVHVDSKPLSNEEELELTISFTAYKDCDALNVPRGMFNCGYGVCILEKYVQDGVVNCPFGDCRDEGSCEAALQSASLLNGESTNFSSRISMKQRSNRGESRRKVKKRRNGASRRRNKNGKHHRANSKSEHAVKRINEGLIRQNNAAERIKLYLEEQERRQEVSNNCSTSDLV